MFYSGIYQDEYEKLDLYQDINNFWGLEPKQKNVETVLHFTHEIINIWKYISHNILKRGMGVVSLSFFYPNIDR